MTDVVAQVEQYEGDEQMASNLQREYDNEVTAHRVQQEIDLEDEFSQATREYDQKLSAKKAQTLDRQLNN